MDKKKTYEKLGAVWFQKVVFKVEDIKFKLIDRVCPNIGNWYSNRCDKVANKLCSKSKDEKEKEQIRFKYNCKKMFFKRELVEKKNRNYHMTLSNANGFYRYLAWNKKIHMNGIIKNVICITGSLMAMGITSGVLSSVALGYLIYNAICLGVNFECVNLQNYNMERFNEKKELLQKLEQRQKNSDAKNYSKVGETIYNKLKESVEMPKQEEVISSISSLDELRQLRSLALEVKRQRINDGRKENTINKVMMKR